MKKTLFILLSTVILASCSDRYYRYNKPSVTVNERHQDGNLFASTEKTPEKKIEKQQRIVIYNAYMTIVVKVQDSTNTILTEIANRYEGYVQTLGSQTSVIRVKADKLHSAVADISKLGKVKSKTIWGDDVTDQFTDLQIRLENAYNARKRYTELLGKAENVEAALKVEKELERLNGEIDTFEGKLSQLNHLSEYSTITINIEEKIKPGILGYIGIGLFKSVKWLFVRN